MAPDDVNSPKTANFPATRIGPLMRALADPEGKDDLTPEQRRSIEQVEANISRLAEDDR